MKQIRIISLLVFLLLFTYCSENNNPVAPKTSNALKDYPTLSILYDQDPDVDNCNEGKLKNSEQIKVLDRVNYFRRLHNLPEVIYNISNDIYTQKASLITVANEIMDHTPASTVKCYSEEGNQGCGKSNLHLGYSSAISNYKSEDAIDSWISEKYSISGIGHRRWLLNPFLKSISFGRVDKVRSDGFYYMGSTIFVSDESTSISTNTEFIACPFNDYPASVFSPELFLSFSVIADKSNVWGENKNVNFAGATIEITDPTNLKLAITDIAFDKNESRQGIANCLQWKAIGMQSGVHYNVSIKNVLVKGANKDYSYQFKLVTPA